MDVIDRLIVGCGTLGLGTPNRLRLGQVRSHQRVIDIDAYHRAEHRDDQRNQPVTAIPQSLRADQGAKEAWMEPALRAIAWSIAPIGSEPIAPCFHIPPFGELADGTLGLVCIV